MSETELIAEAPELIEAARIRCDASAAEFYANGDCCTLLYIYEGRGQCGLNGAGYTVKEGEMVVLHPRAHYRLSSLPDKFLRGIRLTFTIGLTGRERGHILQPDQLPIISLGRYQQLMSQYLEHICNESETPSAGGKEMVRSLMQAVTILLIRLLDSGQARGELSVTQQVKAYIEQHYDKELSLADLAQLVHVSPFHLGHVFKEEAGMAPIQYLIHCRIEEAKRMLAKTGYSIVEIAEAVGYPNANYFNQIFKKMAGVSPGKYRAMADR